jgi:hypothetical protein
MTKIGLLGDTHGDIMFSMRSANTFAKRGVTSVLQLGDFGFWGDQRSQQALNDLDYCLARLKQIWYVTPGNHEDYNYLDSLPVEDDGWQQIRPNIMLAPRGHRWTWEGRSFVSLGGAPSVDRQWRLRDMNHPKARKSWWHQEAITDEDVQKVVDGGVADVMVAHDAPFGTPGVERRIAPNPIGFPKIDLDYAYEGRQRVRKAFDAVQPKVFAHGHYHFYNNEIWHVPSAPFTRDIKFTTNMLCLACNGEKHALGELDLDILSVHSIEDRGRADG